MRQLKIAFLFLFTCSLNAVESQLNMSFQRRFGPNSFIYNEPLYFTQRAKKKKKTRVTGSYREQIRKKLKKTNRKRPSLSAKTIE